MTPPADLNRKEDQMKALLTGTLGCSAGYRLARR